MTMKMIGRDLNLAVKESIIIIMLKIAPPIAIHDYDLAR